MKNIHFHAFIFAVLSVVTACDKSASAPEITVSDSNSRIIVPAQGGDFVIDYEIVNPAPDGAVTVEVPTGNDWIADPVADNNSKTVRITVLPNRAKETRDALVTLKYTFGNRSVSTSVFFFQQEMVFDYYYECSKCVSTYWGLGQAADPNLHLCYLTLQTHEDMENPVANSAIYYIDLWNQELAEDKLPLPGTYTMVPYKTEVDFSCNDYFSYCELFGDDIVDFSDYKMPDFTGGEGTVTVERDGSVYTIKGEFTDTEGLVHYVSFNGEPDFVDKTILSTLDKDVSADFTGYDIVAINWGDYYETELNYWSLQIKPLDIGPDDHFLFLEVLTPLTVDTETGFNEAITFVDIYTYDEDPNATSCYIPGLLDYVNSWFLTCDFYDPSDASIYLKAPCGPCMKGPVTLTPDGEGTFAISADVFDDLGYNIRISGDKLTITYYDYSAPASASSAGIRKCRLAKPQPRKSSIR